MLWNLVPMNIVHIFLFLDSWVSFLLVIYHIYLWKVSIFLTVNNKCNKYCRVGWWQNIYPPHKQEPKTTTMNCNLDSLDWSAAFVYILFMKLTRFGKYIWDDYENGFLWNIVHCINVFLMYLILMVFSQFLKSFLCCI